MRERVIDMDITNNFNNCLSLLISIFTNLFNKLDSIQIWGTTLLNIYVNIVIIGAMIPIILTLANTARMGQERYDRRAEANRARQARQNKGKKGN